jgi:hypothetical protein
MGIWAGLKRAGIEGTGVGATKRFGWLIIRETSNPFSSSRDALEKVRVIRRCYDSGFLEAACSRLLRAA